MQHEPSERLDVATSGRLAKLGERPVDISRLEQNLEAAMSQQDVSRHGRQGSRMVLASWLRPIAGLAAAVALVVSLVIALNTSTPQASAAVVELTELHHRLVAGEVQMTAVTSMHEANAWIASQQATAPALPSELANARVQSCCLVDVQGELMAVAVLQEHGVVVTLVVTQADNFAHEMGTVVEIEGERYFGHELNGIRMMMANLEDRWLCVMGDLSYEQLAKLAAKARF